MSVTKAQGVDRRLFDPEQVKCVGIVPALHKRQIAAAVNEVAQWFGSRGIHVVLPAREASSLALSHMAQGADKLASCADLLISMGGDGTFLATARVGAPSGKPILGINLGGFGFLASIPGAKMIEGLAAVMAGRFEVSDRMMLESTVFREGEEVGSFLALNDIVVGKGAFSRLFRLKTSISGEPVSDFPGDGMIVSTATGSTGYSLAAGGPVVDPEVPAIMLTPICAHALSARTLVVPADREITIDLPHPRGEEVRLTADGQEGIALRAGDQVRVRRAPFCARVISLEGTGFCKRLRSKFGWGAYR